MPFGVWQVANERAESWENEYKKLFDAAHRLIHANVSRREYGRAFNDLRSVVEAVEEWALELDE